MATAPPVTWLSPLSSPVISLPHQVRDLVRAHFGPDRFRYVYHIDQSDGGDRMLDIVSDGDVQFDEELYKHLQARSLVITPSSEATEARAAAPERRCVP